MNVTQITEPLSWLGNKSGLVTQKSISWLSTFGLKISEFQSKILNILIISIVIFLVLKLMTSFKTIVKIGIIVLLAILGISIIISFF